MFELIIFLISCFIIYIIVGNLFVKIKGGELGCFSFIFTILISFLISLSIAKNLNPNKAESFFFRDQITEKVGKYKSSFKYKNKEYLQTISKNTFYNLSGNKNEVKELNIGCLCRDGTIVSSIKSEACSKNGGVYERIFIEVEQFIPEKKYYNINNSALETAHSGGPVHVRGYTRKDGTFVRPHTRRAPRR